MLKNERQCRASTLCLIICIQLLYAPHLLHISLGFSEFGSLAALLPVLPYTYKIFQGLSTVICPVLQTFADSFTAGWFRTVRVCPDLTGGAASINCLFTSKTPFYVPWFVFLSKTPVLWCRPLRAIEYTLTDFETNDYLTVAPHIHKRARLQYTPLFMSSAQATYPTAPGRGGYQLDADCVALQGRHQGGCSTTRATLQARPIYKPAPK